MESKNLKAPSMLQTCSLFSKTFQSFFEKFTPVLHSSAGVPQVQELAKGSGVRQVHIMHGQICETRWQKKKQSQEAEFQLWKVFENNEHVCSIEGAFKVLDSTACLYLKAGWPSSVPKSWLASGVPEVRLHWSWLYFEKSTPVLLNLRYSWAFCNLFITCYNPILHECKIQNSWSHWSSTYCWQFGSW